jgi:hypothetical protein
VALEISSFKCGHDAPVYTVVERIIEQSGTPYFCFKDLDENKPASSIKIRVETIDYFLKRYRDDLLHRNQAESEIKTQRGQYECWLRESHGLPNVARLIVKAEKFLLPPDEDCYQ